MKKTTITFITLAFTLLLNAHTYPTSIRSLSFRNINIIIDCDMTDEELRKSKNYQIGLTGAWFIQTFHPEIDYWIRIGVWEDIKRYESAIIYDNFNENMNRWYRWYFDNENQEQTFEFDFDSPRFWYDIFIEASKNLETVLKLLDYAIIHREILWKKINRAIKENCIADFRYYDRSRGEYEFDSDAFEIEGESIMRILNARNARVAQFLARYPSIEYVERAVDLFVEQQNEKQQEK